MIYASTSCLKNPKSIEKVLDAYQKSDIRNVELGSVHENFDTRILKKYEFNYTIHNYFPPPKNPFIFNLASSNKTILKKSIKLAKDAIDFCVELNSPVYSFHAGFLIDPIKLGKKLPRKKITVRENATKIFEESLFELIFHASKNGIKLAMEPNVVQKFNLVNGKNELLLFAEYDEIISLLKIFSKKELGLLLDLGHTSVTSHWLNFDKDRFVDSLCSRVIAVHVSNNNGLQDQHKALTPKCWAVTKLKKFKRKPIILETMNLSTDEIKKNIKIASKSIE